MVVRKDEELTTELLWQGKFWELLAERRYFNVCNWLISWGNVAELV